MTKRFRDRFPVFIQIAGIVTWTCPRCGRVNRHRLAPGQFGIRCRGSHCRRAAVLGFLYYTPIQAGPIGGLNLPGDPPDGLILDALPDQVDAAEQTSSEPMLQAQYAGDRKPYAPVHRVKLDG